MKLRLGPALAIAGALLLASCGSDDGPREAGAGDGATEGPIVIGLLDEQTGPTAAVQGKAGDGARAAVDAINEAGGIDGRQIELVTRDTAGDPATTLQGVTELKEAGAVAIVGPVNGAICQAMPAGLRRVEIPAICLSPADLPEEDDFLFGIGVELAQVDQASFDLLAEENGKVGVIAQKTALGALIDEHIEEYEDPSVEFVVERVEPTDTTARAQLQNLIDAEVGGILVGPCGPLAFTTAREAVDLGYEGKIMMYNCLASEAGAQGIAGFANGNILTLASLFALDEVPEDDPQHPAYTAMMASGAERDVVAATGWDGMYLVKQAIEAAGSTEAADIIDVLEGGFSFAGAWSLNEITADDHRGASADNALIPVVFTPEGTMERLTGR